MARDRRDPAVSITSAREPLAQEQARRARRYLVQMSIRVLCFIGTVVIDHWIRWVLLVGAVILPYVAVVLANAGRSRGEEPGTFVDSPRHLPGPSGPDPARNVP